MSPQIGNWFKAAGAVGAFATVFTKFVADQNWPVAGLCALVVLFGLLLWGEVKRCHTSHGDCEERLEKSEARFREFLESLLPDPDRPRRRVSDRLAASVHSYLANNERPTGS